MNKDLITEKIDIAQYTYELPDNRIAKYPLEKRDESKLLVFNEQKEISTCPFHEVVNHLPSNSLLVFNNTRVIHARIEFRKVTGARIEVFCLKPYYPVDYQQIFSSKKSCQWVCMIGNLKKWKNEKLELTSQQGDISYLLTAEKYGIDDLGNTIVTFSWESDHTFAEILEHIGRIPIPPYLNRESEDIDNSRYQTVYSLIDGSVAAPTAGLHFTSEVLRTLESKNIKTCELTLHVGAGTFQPVKSSNAREHQMHGERIIINVNLIDNLISNLGNITATGTTSLRSLESLYWMGIKVINNLDPTFLAQWDWENLDTNISTKDSLVALSNYIKKTSDNLFSATTEIMIVPGYRFRIVDYLITNFHQPNSTLLLLIAAFIGSDWKRVYDYALKNNFRFLSYGDSSLLYPSRKKGIL